MSKYFPLWALLKDNPAVVWFVSGAQTMVTSAFPLSMVYPEWAHDLTTHVIDKIPIVWEVAKEVAMELLSNPP